MLDPRRYDLSPRVLAGDAEDRDIVCFRGAPGEYQVVIVDIKQGGDFLFDFFKQIVTALSELMQGIDVCEKFCLHAGVCV
jgi:hypothetical protein